MSATEDYQHLKNGIKPYKQEKILVTGGAGFIGAHLINKLLQSYPEIELFNIDNLSCPSNLIIQSGNYSFIKEDIRNKKAIFQIVHDYKIEKIFHLAAESHVDHSIQTPDIFFETNVMGTNNLLEASRSLWLENGKLNPFYQNARFLHISTDEVYGSLGDKGYFSEESNYNPSSPYSASKAASDLMALSYCKTYNFPAIITNCSNNFGPGQHRDKFIPKIIDCIINKKTIPIYGNGNNIREWLYVEEHCKILDYIMQHGKIGEKYNIGSGTELSNLNLAKLICQIIEELDGAYCNSYNLIEFVKDRPYHDYRYALNTDKIKALGFDINLNPNIIDDLKSTIAWYL